MTIDTTAQKTSFSNVISAVVFAAVHLMCLFIFVTGVSWVAVAVCMALYFIRMFAITGGYHRYFSHRSYKTGRIFQFVIAFVGASAAQKGRFIICTANDTSKIDPTFKRPGRMDEFIYFTKCDALMIHQLMDLFYDGTVDEKRVRSKEELERFGPAEFQLSPSELNKICFNNILSREDAENRVLEKMQII